MSELFEVLCFGDKVLAELRHIKHLLSDCRDRPARHSCIAINGPSGEYAAMLNLRTNQTGTVVFTFQDNTQNPPVAYPLASSATPTVDDTTKATVVATSDGTKDGIVNCTVTPVPGATPGPFNVLILGHGAVDGSDDIPGSYACAIIGNEDNAVVATSFVNTAPAQVTI